MKIEDLPATMPGCQPVTTRTSKRLN